MADVLKKVQSGDPLVIPAQAYNAFIDAARDYQQRTRHVGQQATPGYRSAGIVLVKNESGTDRLRFEVLGLGEPIILPDADANAIVKKPLAVYIEKVYEENNFAGLGIGT